MSDQTGDDCILPVRRQNLNIACFATFWGIYYLAAPVSYVGVTHANLLKALGNSDKINNLPAAAYMWMAFVPVVTAWFFPQPRLLKPIALVCVAAMAVMTGVVAVILYVGTSVRVTTIIIVAHAVVFGASSGVLLTTMWDLIRRGVSTCRRGKALGYTFGVGPLFACVAALLQDAVFKGNLLGGWTFGLTFPMNYMAMFAAVAPLLLGAGVCIACFAVPELTSPVEARPPADEIVAGLRQVFENRAVLFAVIIYILAYSGGNGILQNVSLHADTVLGKGSDTLGVQSFLRFGFKAAAGVMLGLLLAKTSPRTTLVATTSVLLVGMAWALASSTPSFLANFSSWWFMLSFGLLGAGELFGAYYPNYVATASAKPYVRLNMSYLSMLSVPIGFSSVAFGFISDAYGRPASFYAAAAILVLAIVLIYTLLPSDPTPKELPAVDPNFL